MTPFRPRPIRDLSSLQNLSGLANQFADLSMRNDLAEQKQQAEINRRANVSRLMQKFQQDASQLDDPSQITQLGVRTINSADPESQPFVADMVGRIHNAKIEQLGYQKQQEQQKRQSEYRGELTNALTKGVKRGEVPLPATEGSPLTKDVVTPAGQGDILNIAQKYETDPTKLGDLALEKMKLEQPKSSTGTYWKPQLDAKGKPITQQFGNDIKVETREYNKDGTPTGGQKYESLGSIPSTNMTGLQKDDVFPELSGKPLLEKLKTVPKTGQGDYALVKSIIDGRTPYDKFGSAKDPIERERVQKLVMRVDPLFDSYWTAGIGALKKNVVAGKEASQLQGMNQLLGHLEEYKSAYESLNNKAISLGNTVKNYIAENTGDPDVTAFRTAAKAVQSEGAGVFKTGQGAASPTTEEIKDWEGIVGLSNSPEQFGEFGKTMAKLLKSRISAINNRLNVIPNKPEGFTLLSPKAAESLLMWGVDINDLTGGQPQKTDNPPTAKTIWDTP